LAEFSSNILTVAENDQVHQSPSPILIYGMVGPHQTVTIFLTKWTTDQVCHNKISNISPAD